MGAVENGALMALAGSLAKLEVRVAEGVELLKDILSCLEGGEPDSGDDEQNPALADLSKAGIPAGDMNSFMEGMLKNALANNPALALALQTMQNGGTNNGSDGKKEG